MLRRGHTPFRCIPSSTVLLLYIDWYNKNEKKLHPIELAAALHQRFVFIPPFIDGNGRMARLLMNMALLRNGFTIAIIPAILRHEYIHSLERAHEDKSIFFEFIADRVLATFYPCRFTRL